MRRAVPIVLVLAVAAVAAAVVLAARPAPPPLRRFAPSTVDVRAPSAALAQQAAVLRLFAGDLTGVIDRARGSDPFALRVDRLVRDGLTLSDVAVRRRGDRFAAEATVDASALGSVAPAGVTLAPRPQPDGALVLEGRASRLGLSIGVKVRVAPVDGAIVAQPQGLPIGPTTLFDDPRARVDGLSARPLPGGRFRLRAVGRLAGSA